MKKVLSFIIFFAILFVLNPSAYSYHKVVTVRPGATLGQIASSHDTTVAVVMSLNGLSNYTIYPGEKLKVPSSGSYRPSYHTVPAAPAFTHYTVRFGDTLSIIAQKYGTSVAELRRINHLYSNVIRQGAVLTVPSGNAGRNKNYAYYGSNGDDGGAKKYAYNKNYYGGSGATFSVISGNRNKTGDNGEKHKIHKMPSVGKKIVDAAYKYLGVPYVWGGTSTSGMDCSGFTQKVFARLDIQIPRTAAEQARFGTYVPKDELRPGDLLFFRTYASYISHVGIYIGDGRFIQENYGAGKVTINRLSDEYFERTYAFAKAVR